MFDKHKITKNLKFTTIIETLSVVISIASKYIRQLICCNYEFQTLYG